MRDLSKDDQAQNNIELLTDKLRNAIDEMTDEHSKVTYREIICALEFMKLEEAHEFFRATSEE